MTLVDSADSVLMLYSYANFPEKGFTIFELRGSPGISEASSRSSRLEQSAPPSTSADVQTNAIESLSPSPKHVNTSQPILPDLERHTSNESIRPAEADYKISPAQQKTLDQAAKNTMSNLSIILTLLSIMVAFR
jgi:high-affinity nickel-transport protein